MKIAVSSLGESLDSPVDQRFGRARFFILYDLDNETWSARSNVHNRDAAQGAGIATAHLVAEWGAQAVITGHCGPNAFAALAAAHIDVYQEARGSVHEMLKAYEKNTLIRSTQANVNAGYGTT